VVRRDAVKNRMEIPMPKSARKSQKAPSKTHTNKSKPARGATPVPRQQPAVARSEGTKADPTTKQSRVIAMLQSPSGATIAAIVKATGWQEHSVRGFLAAVVRKRLKLTLQSEKVDGERIYRIGGEAPTKAAEQKRRAA
jgi:hypothetical protein